MKKFFVGVVSVLFVLNLSACTSISDQKETQNSVTETKEKITVQIKLKNDGKIVSTKKIVVDTGETLLNALKANYSVKDDGKGFITSIDGKSQDTTHQKYWTYTINGESATVGASQYKLKKSDSIVFDLSKYEE